MIVRVALGRGWRVASLAFTALRVVAVARGVKPLARTGAAAPTFTVVVPARNEETRIVPLLGVLRQLVDRGAEVVVIDDRSTDSTAEVVSAADVPMIRADEPPVGCNGKVGALRCGVRSASGEWIVVIDADTQPEPDLVYEAVAYAADQRLGLLTLAPSFECADRGVAWLHPAMLTNLVYRRGGPSGRSHLANGQFMVLPRSTAAEMLPAVAETVAEDVALAKLIAVNGGRVEFLDASDRLIVRPYRSLSETFHRWGRSMALPTPRIFAATVLMSPWWRVLRGRADVIDVVALALRAGALAGTSRSYRPRSVWYWLSPLADPIAVLALIWYGLRSRSGPR